MLGFKEDSAELQLTPEEMGRDRQEGDGQVAKQRIKKKEKETSNDG